MDLSETTLREFAMEFGRFLPPPVIHAQTAPASTGDMVRPKVFCQVVPGDGCISDTQAFNLQQLVRAVVERHRIPFQTVWSSLNVRNCVPSYRLTPGTSYPTSVAYLERWRDVGIPPL